MRRACLHAPAGGSAERILLLKSADERVDTGRSFSANRAGWRRVSGGVFSTVRPLASTLPNAARTFPRIVLTPPNGCKPSDFCTSAFVRASPVAVANFAIDFIREHTCDQFGTRHCALWPRSDSV